jgi:hypothetical protein
MGVTVRSLDPDASSNVWNSQSKHPSIAERLFLGYDAPLSNPPGVKMDYADYGYELARISERASVAAAGPRPSAHAFVVRQCHRISRSGMSAMTLG